MMSSDRHYLVELATTRGKENLCLYILANALKRCSPKKKKWSTWFTLSDDLVGLFKFSRVQKTWGNNSDLMWCVQRILMILSTAEEI